MSRRRLVITSRRRREWSVSGTVSIGEADAFSDDYALAYYKSQEAAGSFLPNEGAVLISLSDKVNLSEQAIEIGKEL